MTYSHTACFVYIYNIMYIYTCMHMCIYIYNVYILSIQRLLQYTHHIKLYNIMWKKHAFFMVAKTFGYVVYTAYQKYMHV